MAPSSLRKQSAIGIAFEHALTGDPAYKQAIFEAYKHAMPEHVRASGARDYDELVDHAYRQLGHETSQQFDALPLRMSFHKNGEGDYENSPHMLADLHGNRHLFVFQGGEKHQHLGETDPRTGLTGNEKFRAVHDAFGHGVEGTTFGPKGEEKAWGVHAQMYSPLARAAATSETRGQNSFVNYTPLNAKLKGKVAEIERHIGETQRDWRNPNPEEDIRKLQAQKASLMRQWQYAPQRSLLLPPEFMRH